MANGIPVVVVSSAGLPVVGYSIQQTSTTAFQVLDGNGNVVFTVDTQTPLVQVGANAETVPLVLNGPSATPSRLQFERAGTLDWQIGLVASSDVLRFLSGTTAVLDLDPVSGLFIRYGKVATAGWGVPAIYASGRQTAQTAAIASLASYTVGAADGTFEISANVLITVATSFSFSVAVTWTDEANNSRTLTIPMMNLAGTISPTMANAGGAIQYCSVLPTVRAKAGTTITVSTQGTFTTVTYNAEAQIRQVA